MLNWRMSEEMSERRSQDCYLVGDVVANLVGNLGADLVNIQTESTVHWRLAFITTGDYAGS